MILSPLPAALAIPLGVDAGWAALSALMTIAERVDPIGVVAPSIQALRDLTTGERDVKSVPGFHPLELLRRVLGREQ